MQRDGKHLLSHTAVYLLARGLPGILAFLMIPIFSRLLHPRDYGRYALIISAVALINAMLFQWMRLALVRYLPAYTNDRQRLQSTLLGASAVLVALLGVGIVAADFIPAAAGWRGVLIACWILLAVQALYDLCCEYTRALMQPWRYMWLQIFRCAVGITLGVVLVLMGWGWWGPLLGLAAGMMVGVLYAYPTDWRDARPRIDRHVLAKLSWYGVPISITVAITVVISSADRFMLAGMLGEAAAGLYSVGVDFTAQTLTLLMLAVNMAAYPSAVHAWEQHGREAAQDQMRINGALLLAIGMPCVIGLVVLAPGIAHSFLGSEFRATAVQVIPLIAIGSFVAGLKAFHFDAAFQFVNKTMFQVGIIALAAGLNIVLNLAAIPRWGIAGAAGASVAAYVAAMAMTIWFGRRHVPLPIPLGLALRVVLASLLMGVALYPFRDHIHPLALTAQVICGIAIYGMTLLATNFLDLREALYGRLRPASPPPAPVVEVQS
jgi:O-antigen/teichoic acid export membrane protein